MKLWILNPITSTRPDPWHPWHGMSPKMIAAETAHDARQAAADKCGDEGQEPWINETMTSCELQR